ncbi:hypothetical protein T06_2252 [Trichinella sp. T6]|nr:hypothetical protein T06_2252 [Trichinella sp. T6]
MHRIKFSNINTKKSHRITVQLHRSNQYQQCTRQNSTPEKMDNHFHCIEEVLPFISFDSKLFILTWQASLIPWYRVGWTDAYSSIACGVCQALLSLTTILTRKSNS